MTGSKTLAVITARGGSKRILGKNIRPFAGRPLIGWVIKAALDSELFCNVLVSTDCEKIRAVAVGFGAVVPFLRPAELSGDSAASEDALIHAVEWWKHNRPGSRDFDTTALIQPTSPFLRSGEILGAVEAFKSGGFTSLTSVRVNDPASDLSKPLLSRGYIFEITGGSRGVRVPAQREDDPTVYRENGAIYLVRTGYLLQTRSLYCFDNHGCYQMAIEDSVDIDTEEDWEKAEMLVRSRL